MCRQCKTTLLATSNASCPHCQKNIKEVIEDQHHKRKIMSLQVYCHYRDEGCKWEGELRDLERHMAFSNPPFTNCACGCGENVRTRGSCMFKERPSSAYCKKRPVTCMYCRLKATYDDITSSHRFTCADFPVNCPNNCKLDQPFSAMNTFKQKHLQKHLEQQCSRRVVAFSSRSESHFADMQTSTFPVSVTLTKFSQCKAENTVWFSPPFFTHKDGYKLKLRVYPNGFGSTVGNHVSVFLSVVHGEHDRTLQWPLRAEITVDLLNWREDKDHHSKKVYFLGDGLCNEAKSSDLITLGKGHAEFISHAALALNTYSKCMNFHDSLRFCVREMVPFPDSHTPIPLWDAGLPSRSIFEFKVPDLSMYCDTGTPYFSTPCYTSLLGYRVCYCVKTQVVNSKKYISVGVQLLKGKHDGKLQWPLRADFTIQALNWNADSKHLMETIRFTDLTPDAACCQVVADDMASESWDIQQFLSWPRLFLTDPQYLKEDCLYFQVKKVVTYAVPGFNNLPRWQDPSRFSYSLCEFALTDFIKRKENENVHYTTPFKTNPQGQMMLEVYSNGYGAGRGSHISIFAHVKKGQGCASFIKPAKGYLAIDVLNWREDSDHYRRVIDFSGIQNSAIPSTDFTSGNLGTPLWGAECFIAHSDLKHHPVKNTEYLHHDCVLLRVQEVSTYSDPLASKIPAWKRVHPPKITKGWEFTLTKFSRYVEQDKEFISHTFYTHTKGYKLCLHIYPNGTETSKGMHVSLYVQLVKGEYDHVLQWPFQADLTIQFLNWTSSAGAHSHTISYTGTTPEVYSTIGQGFLFAEEWGRSSFIEHGMLAYNYETNTQYLLDDCLYVEIKDIAVYSDHLAHKSPSWQPLTNYPEYTLNHFFERAHCESTYYSPPFYAFEGGYKMRLEVYPSRDTTPKQTHLSLYCRLLRGENDDALEWPIELDVVTELLNWQADRDHFQRVITFGNQTSQEARNRVVNGEQANSAWGFGTYIALERLFSQELHKPHYVEDNCVRIRVRDVVVHTPLSKKTPQYLWSFLKFPSRKLFEFTLANFSRRRTYNSIYYSEAFYINKEGYKFRMEVYANGTCEGKGSHVSVFFVNLKGEYDDQLRWPVKVKFHFQLVNWKSSNAETHLSKQVDFDSNRPQEEEGHSWGFREFISHHSLYNPSRANVIYLEQDCLRFRVTGIS